MKPSISDKVTLLRPVLLAGNKASTEFKEFESSKKMIEFLFREYCYDEDREELIHSLQRIHNEMKY